MSWESRPPGNTRLVEHGIQTEESDLRAHVCVAVRRVYLFPTCAGVAAVRSGRHECRSIRVGGIETARGVLVPPRMIDGTMEVVIPEDVLAAAALRQDETTSEKGRKAVGVVAECLRRGLVRLPSLPRVVRDEDLQIRGFDIIVLTNLSIQVKCDYVGGPRAYGGSGSLFLQTHECNPWQEH